MQLWKGVKCIEADGSKRTEFNSQTVNIILVQ